MCLIVWSSYVWKSQNFMALPCYTDLKWIDCNRDRFLSEFLFIETEHVLFHADIFIDLDSSVIHSELWTPGKRSGTLCSSHSLASHLLRLVLWCFFQKETFPSSVNQIGRDVHTETRGKTRNLEGENKSVGAKRKIKKLVEEKLLAQPVSQQNLNIWLSYLSS